MGSGHGRRGFVAPVAAVAASVAVALFAASALGLVPSLPWGGSDADFGSGAAPSSAAVDPGGSSEAVGAGDSGAAASDADGGSASLSTSVGTVATADDGESGAGDAADSASAASTSVEELPTADAEGHVRAVCLDLAAAVGGMSEHVDHDGAAGYGGDSGGGLFAQSVPLSGEWAHAASLLPAMLSDAGCEESLGLVSVTSPYVRYRYSVSLGDESVSMDVAVSASDGRVVGMSVSSIVDPDWDYGAEQRAALAASGREAP